MRLLLVPGQFIKFWFLEAVVVLGRTWKNLILYLEEDLAVGLMWRLLFVPLFHDFSIVGRSLSFIFRLLRITIGIFAFASASVLMVAATAYWLALPVLVFIGPVKAVSLIFIFAGAGLFVIHKFSHPEKKIWQVKGPAEAWSCSGLKKSQLDFQKLLTDEKVRLMLSYLQATPGQFSNFQLVNGSRISEIAFKLAKDLGSEYLDSRHFFLAVLETNPNLDSVLLKIGLENQDLRGAFKYLQLKEKNWRRVYLWDWDFTITHLRGTNRGWLGVPTPSLDAISLDLTREAARGNLSTLFGRGSLISEVINILSREKLSNVILVGPAGSGKTTLIGSLAKRIVSGDAPGALSTKRMVEIDLTRLLSGVKTQGDLAQRIKSAFEEAQYAQNIILVMEEIHNIATGQVGTDFNLYSLIAPFLEFGNVQFIATTESANYAKVLEKNGVFARLFTKVIVPPATELETMDILLLKAIEIERRKKIRVSYPALKKAASLSALYIHDRCLPDSAISILDEAQTHATDGWITSKTIEEVFGTRVNVPVAEVGNVQKDKLLNLENIIHERLIDQEEAVGKLSDTLRRGAANLRESGRPIGSFLFVGPTGVGKTELAKILADTYFDKNAYLRFDMSEYQNENSMDRLLSELTEQVKSRPYCLMLLDEFEKADPKILTLFLQVLEDGRLTDTEGETVDFKSTIIIATSNVGSLLIAQGLQQGRTLEEIDKQVNDELLQVFKPELVNRFDGVVLFKPLSEEHLQKIVEIKLQELKNTLRKQGYVVEFNEALVGELAKRGFDPVLGARPLRRLIQDTLEANLSKLILENKLIKGQTFKVGVDLLIS